MQLLWPKVENKNCRTNDGKTAVHLAAERGHLDLLKFMIENGAEKEPLDNDGNSPLHLAIENGKNLKFGMLLWLDLCM